MAKFCGKIGFVESRETSPGVWTEEPIERSYTGDVTRNMRYWNQGQNLNDDFNVSNSISIVADNYLYEHLGIMKYVTWMGTKWKISSIEVQRPRLILSIGGVYNG